MSSITNYFQDIKFSGNDQGNEQKTNHLCAR